MGCVVPFAFIDNPKDKFSKPVNIPTGSKRLTKTTLTFGF